MQQGLTATCKDCVSEPMAERRSRTAKASSTSRHAVKSRCAHEWDGWGRKSDDGSGHYNPNPSEDPLGPRRVITLLGGARWSLRPDLERDNRCDQEANAGNRLKPLTIRAPLGKPASQPYWGNPAVRNLQSFEARSARAS